MSRQKAKSYGKFWWQPDEIEFDFGSSFAEGTMDAFAVAVRRRDANDSLQDDAIEAAFGTKPDHKGVGWYAPACSISKSLSAKMQGISIEFFKLKAIQAVGPPQMHGSCYSLINCAFSWTTKQNANCW